MSSIDAAFIHDIKVTFNAVSETPVILRKSNHVTMLEIDPVQFKGADALLILKQKTASSDQLFHSDPKFSDGSVGVLSLISILALARKRLDYV